MLSPKAYISSKEYPDCSKSTRKRFFNNKKNPVDSAWKNHIGASKRAPPKKWIFSTTEPIYEQIIEMKILKNDQILSKQSEVT